MKIRNSAKAIIIRNGQLLCNENRDIRGVFYCVPGGGQEYQENLAEAVRRECQEEIQAEIEVGELLFVRDYIGKNHAEQERLRRIHQVEFFFAATLKEGQIPKMGPVPDSHQIGIKWVPISELEELNFFPKDMIPWLQQLGDMQRPVYLGDMD